MNIYNYSGTSVTMAGTCEYSNELSGSTKHREILD